MSKEWKYLAIADDSPECSIAVLFAAYQAQARGWSLVLLRVHETESFAHWIGVTEEIRTELRETNEALVQALAHQVQAETGDTPTVLIRQGNLVQELARLLDEDVSIRMVVLGAGQGRNGPGPLVAQLGKSGRLAGRGVPVIVVPGSLSIDEIRALDH